MKILVIVSDFPKVTETFALANVLHYLRAGHDADIFHLKPYRRDEVIHAHARPALERGFTFAWLDPRGLSLVVTRPGRLGRTLAQIVRAHWHEPRRLLATFAILPKSLALARWARRERVAHIHAEFAGYPATCAWIVHQLTGIPFSFSAHAHDIFISQSLLAEKAQAATFVRAISRFNIRFLERLPGFPKDKARLLRCGVSVQDPLPLPDRLGPVQLLFVGALLPRKGVDLLLDAVARLSPQQPWHLTVVGDGSQRQALEDQSQRLGLSDRVRFVGAQPAERVQDFIGQAQAVIVPSRVGTSGRSEGIPVVCMEALSHARPVIAARLSGIPELVEDGVTGRLFEPEDITGLTHAIDWVITHEDEARRLGQAGRKRVEEDYDIDKTATQLLAAIEGAVA